MKKLLAVILYFVLILSLIGCGGRVNEEAPSSTDSSSIKELTAQVWFSDDGVTLTKNDLEAAINQEYVKPKNVIIMISDGMGLNDLKLAYKFSDFLFDYGLTFDKFPNIGTAITNNLDNEVTDSAASATALATGEKTSNERIGLGGSGEELKNALELAREKSKRVGVVTNDFIYGATPSAFTVHNLSRENTAEICCSYVDFAPDVLIGGGYSSFMANVRASQKHSDKLQNINIASRFDLWQDKLNEDLRYEKPFFGFFYPKLNVADYQLAQATELAINRLKNDKGFFLMVESTGCDKGGHSGDAEKKVTAVGVFDKAVAVAVKFCLENPDTILIVTSDHETGGVTLPSGDYKLFDDIFTTDNHTGTNVGVFALGYGTEYFNGKTVDNTDIGKFLHTAIKGETYK